MDNSCTYEWSGDPECCEPTPASFDFEVDEGLIISGGLDACGWNIIESPLATSGSSLLYYGDPAAMNYDCGEQLGSALSPPITLAGGFGYELRFDLRMATEVSGTYDILTVYAVLEDGTKSALWTKANLPVAETLETKVAPLLGLAGETFQLEFEFDTVDGVVNATEGVFIDNVRVVSGCVPDVCETDLECDDLLPCSSDLCVEGACASAPIVGCCAEDAACDDGDPCTADSCQDFACVNADIAGCCLSGEDCDDDHVCTEDVCAENVCSNDWAEGCCEEDSGCDDSDICTIDTCPDAGGQCSNAINALCCASAADCEDGLACTLDACQANTCVSVDNCCETDLDCGDDNDCSEEACVDGACSYAWSNSNECCAPEVASWTFEEPAAFTLGGTAPPCGWQIAASDEAQSGSFVLYYGDPESWNFDCGASSGSALSPMIQLQAPGFAYSLSFKLAMYTEASTSYDHLFIYAVLSDGNEHLLWSKTSLVSANTWHQVEANLSAIGGADFQLRFDFDTVDTVANGTPGVFIDDILIESECGPTACVEPGDCDDGYSWSTDTCENGECAYASQ